MSESIKLDILTPRGPKREGTDVSGVEVPGLEGELGVLPHHETLVTAIVPGVVRFREDDKSTRIAVGSGFLEVKNDGRVVLLVEQALEVDEIDVEGARTALAEARSALDQNAEALDEPHRRRLETDHAWFQAQLRAAAPDHPA